MDNIAVNQILQNPNMQDDINGKIDPALDNKLQAEPKDYNYSVSNDESDYSNMDSDIKMQTIAPKAIDINTTQLMTNVVGQIQELKKGYWKDLLKYECYRLPNDYKTIRLKEVNNKTFKYFKISCQTFEREALKIKQ